MKVYVLSDKKQSFNGKNYWLDKSSGYYRNAQIKPHSLHRQVWIYHNGDIPQGYVIDHIDRNRNNNQIENLRLTTQSENSKNVSEETTKKRKENMDKIRLEAIKWHKSDDGRRWHSEMAKKSYEKRKPIKKVCAFCGKEYYTTQYAKNARFCHQNCKMKARRRRLKGLSEDAEL